MHVKSTSLVKQRLQVLLGVCDDHLYDIGLAMQLDNFSSLNAFNQ